MMLCDWSAACSADDPVLVVPWVDAADSSRRFVDLRENPYDLDLIAEAEQFPALLHGLRALNAGRSPVFTAKCDTWPMQAEELDALRMELDVNEKEMPAGFASYIDLVWRDRTIFASFHQQEQTIHRLIRHAAALDDPYAMLDCVIRPALLDLTVPQEGFSVSLYIKALGADERSAEQHWSAALEAVVALLRSRELGFGQNLRN